MTDRLRALRRTAVGLVMVVALGCGSRAGAAPTPSAPATPTSSEAAATPATTVAAPAMPAGSPTPVPGGPTEVWTAQLALADGTYPLPVMLLDGTGLVTGLVAPAAGVPAFESGVTNANGKPDRLLYTWLGGACDTLTKLTFERSASGFRLRAETETSGGYCILIGLNREVVITLSEPVDARSVVLVER